MPHQLKENFKGIKKAILAFLFVLSSICSIQAIPPNNIEVYNAPYYSKGSAVSQYNKSADPKQLPFDESTNLYPVKISENTSPQVINPAQFELEYIASLSKNFSSSNVPQNEIHSSRHKREVEAPNKSIALYFPDELKNANFPTDQNPTCKPAWDKLFDLIVKNVYAQNAQVQATVDAQLKAFLGFITSSLYGWDIQNMLKPATHSDAQDLSYAIDAPHTECYALKEASGTQFGEQLCYRKIMSQTAGGRIVDSSYISRADVAVNGQKANVDLVEDFDAQIGGRRVQDGRRKTTVSITFPSADAFEGVEASKARFASFDINSVQEKVSQLSAGQVAVEFSVQIVKSRMLTTKSNELRLVQNITAFNVNCVANSDIVRDVSSDSAVTNAFKEQLIATKTVTHIYEIDDAQQNPFTFKKKHTHEAALSSIDGFLSEIVGTVAEYTSETIRKFLEDLVKSCAANEATNPTEGCRILGYFVKLVNSENDEF